jgi:hypothetical protein
VEHKGDHEPRLWPDGADRSTTWLRDEVLARDRIALDADATVIAHYVGEAQCRGVGPVLNELLAWVARLGALGPGPDGDALDHAEPLGDDVERITDTGELAAEPSGFRASSHRPPVALPGPPPRATLRPPQ